MNYFSHVIINQTVTQPGFFTFLYIDLKVCGKKPFGEAWLETIVEVTVFVTSQNLAMIVFFFQWQGIHDVYIHRSKIDFQL